MRPAVIATVVVALLVGTLAGCAWQAVVPDAAPEGFQEIHDYNAKEENTMPSKFKPFSLPDLTATEMGPEGEARAERLAAVTGCAMPAAREAIIWSGIAWADLARACRG